MTDQDWLRHDHAPQTPALPSYPQETLWTLTKGDRVSRAVVRRLPHGKDLCFFVGDELYESELFRIDGDPRLLARAEEKRIAFRRLGWSDA